MAVKKPQKKISLYSDKKGQEKIQTLIGNTKKIRKKDSKIYCDKNFFSLKSQKR